MGASKLRWPKESSPSNTANNEKQDAGTSEHIKLMEFAFRMGASSNGGPSLPASAARPAEPSAPVFPALQDAVRKSAPAVPHVSPAAEAHKVEKTNCFSFRFLFFKTTVVCDDSVHQATDEDLMPKHEAMLALEDGPLEEAGDTGNSEREPEQPPSGTVEVQQPGEDFEEDSLAKMQRALKSRDDGKGNIEKLGAKPKAVGCMKKPAASKKVDLKAKAKVVPQRHPQKPLPRRQGKYCFCGLCLLKLYTILR